MSKDKYHSNNPNHADVLLYELEDFYETPKDKAYVRDEYLQIQCELDNLTPNLHLFLFTDEKRFKSFPYVSAAWIANTHKDVTVDDVFPLFVDEDLKIMVQIKAMVRITAEDISRQPKGKFRDELIECLESYSYLMKRDPMSYVALGD